MKITIKSIIRKIKKLLKNRQRNIKLAIILTIIRKIGRRYWPGERFGERKLKIMDKIEMGITILMIMQLILFIGTSIGISNGLFDLRLIKTKLGIMN